MNNVLRPINDTELRVQVVKRRGIYNPCTDCIIKTRSPDVLVSVKDILIKAAINTEKKRKIANEKVNSVSIF